MARQNAATHNTIRNWEAEIMSRIIMFVSNPGTVHFVAEAQGSVCELISQIRAKSKIGDALVEAVEAAVKGDDFIVVPRSAPPAVKWDDTTLSLNC